MSYILKLQDRNRFPSALLLRNVRESMSGFVFVVKKLVKSCRDYFCLVNKSSENKEPGVKAVIFQSKLIKTCVFLICKLNLNNVQLVHQK